MEDGGRVLAAILWTPPYSVVFSHVEDMAALQPVADDLHARFQVLPGVMGTPEVARTFAERWSALSGQPHAVKMHERVYQLERVIPPPHVPGEMRMVTPADRELLIEWSTGFYRETFQEERPRADAERLVDSVLTATTGRGQALWIDGGQPVSMAGYRGPTPNGIRIGPVYTPPECRRRGYAGALTAALSQKLLDEGRRYCFLFTDLNNPTSNHIYSYIGYQPICDFDMYEFIALNA